MSAEPVAGGSRRVVALMADGRTRVFASVDGSKPQPFSIVLGEVTNETLAASLSEFREEGITTTVLIIGTRADGTPGWDGIDPEIFSRSTPHQVRFLSEAQALALDPNTKQSAAWLIAARETTNSLVSGSVRWWLQAADGTVQRADVNFLGKNYGQLCTDIGAGSPTLMAGMIESIILNHPDVRCVYLWSKYDQTSMSEYHPGGDGQPVGLFWQTLKLRDDFAAAGGTVVVLTDPQQLLCIASANYHS